MEPSIVKKLKSRIKELEDLAGEIETIRSTLKENCKRGHFDGWDWKYDDDLSLYENLGNLLAELMHAHRYR